MEIQHINFTRAIKNGDKKAFDKFFIDHYKSLHAYAFTIIKEKDDAEELVQNLFVHIWNTRAELDPDGSLKSYLYRSVYNQCLNYLKHQKVRSRFALHYAGDSGNHYSDLQQELSANELQRHIFAAINELPEKCRVVFQMSRFEQLKYHQIADKLNISVKTVENQMGKALKALRLKVADLLLLLILMIK